MKPTVFPPRRDQCSGVSQAVGLKNGQLTEKETVKK
jgi:hypothetical protein